MNNRNQQTARVPAPAEATAPTYLNVFTVEEYESNGKTGKPMVFCGDLNVAHTEIDLANPKNNRRNAGFTDEERANFSRLISRGFIDTFREFEAGPGHYSWWSQMGIAGPEISDGGVITLSRTRSSSPP